MPNPSSSEKLRKKLSMKMYLKELTVLAGRPVQANELGSVEKAVSVRKAGQKFSTLDAASFEIPFADLSSERFRRFVRKLYNANPSSVYVWSPRTIDCGVFLMPSIAAINFDFDFEINEEGILVFLTNDLKDRLLVDFFILSQSHKRSKVEVQGNNWGEIIY